MEKVTSKSYTLLNENGGWLGQIVLTSDGMFSSVTDWGNFSYVWRNFGNDFREFILKLNVSYFGSKMQNGLSYIAHTRKTEAACNRFAAEILPALQKALEEEIKKEFIGAPQTLEP